MSISVDLVRPLFAPASGGILVTLMASHLQPIPYLHFDGNCRDTIDFYAGILGATVGPITTFGDMEPDAPKSEISDRIANVELTLPGKMALYLGDCHPMYGAEKFGGITLTLNYTDVAEGEAAFHKLAEGGEITMPWSDTFWAEKFGGVKDKFGVSWLVNGGFKEENAS